MQKENKEDKLPKNRIRLYVELDRPGQIAWVDMLTTDDKKVRGFSVMFELPAMFVNFDYKNEGDKHMLTRSGIQSNNFAENLSKRVEDAIKELPDFPFE
jgi:hypothetical protein